MTNEELISFLTEMSPAAIAGMGKQYVEITVKNDDLHDFMLRLKNNPELAFDYLFCLSGVDHAETISVVYHLESTSHKHVLVVKAHTSDRVSPVLDTVSDIWPTAEFHEREVYDLLGVIFNNHPDLRRLFLDDTWGFPLRKDFSDDIHVVER